MSEHANALLLRRLFTALQDRNHDTMAECYAPSARFHDIAFDLHDRREIHAMWRMICATTAVTVTIEGIEADERGGVARVVDRYTFSDTGNPVVNKIESRFRFQDGRILEHHDDCDARSWARQAIGGPAGWLAGRFRPLRAWKAGRKLRPYLTS
jgi:ketosteroid isomerase-like protein